MKLLNRVPPENKTIIMNLLQLRNNGTDKSALELNNAAKQFNIRYCSELKHLDHTSNFYVGKNGRLESRSIDGDKARMKRLGREFTKKGQQLFAGDRLGERGPDALITDFARDEVNGKLIALDATTKGAEIIKTIKYYPKLKRKTSWFEKLKRFLFGNPLKGKTLSQAYKMLSKAQYLRDTKTADMLFAEILKVDPLGLLVFKTDQTFGCKITSVSYRSTIAYGDKYTTEVICELMGLENDPKLVISKDQLKKLVWEIKIAEGYNFNQFVR